MDAIFHRRSIRAYTERNAEEDKILQILRAMKKKAAEPILKIQRPLCKLTVRFQSD